MASGAKFDTAAIIRRWYQDPLPPWQFTSAFRALPLAHRLRILRRLEREEQRPDVQDGA